MINFILGIIFMSFLSFLAIISFDNDKETLGVILSGPFSWICLCFVNTVEFIGKVIRHSKYKSALIDSNGKPCYCDSKYTQCLLEDGYDFNYSLYNKYEIKDGWNKKDCNMNIINLRYTPMKIIRKENMYKIPKTVLIQAETKYSKENNK